MVDTDNLFRKAFTIPRQGTRLPAIEWASWWDQTLRVWQGESVLKDVALNDYDKISSFWGLDKLHQFWFRVREDGCPKSPHNEYAVVHDEKEYQEIKKFLFTDKLLDLAYKQIKEHISDNKNEGYAYWYTLEGFFWFPRTLFGIEDHFYSFYDYPELMLEMNRDATEFYHKLLEVIYNTFNPVFMTFAEDMSYNLGPMLSKEQYDSFILPFYKELTPIIKEQNTRVIIDTDGNVEPLIPWFIEGGVEGVLPLERMAGVDVNRIRENYPDFLMIGGYDKTIMHLGEEAMRKEFERILPAIKSGGYIPGVDHQTPPDVSVENYRTYVRLLYEYCSVEKLGLS